MGGTRGRVCIALPVLLPPSRAPVLAKTVSSSIPISPLERSLFRDRLPLAPRLLY